MKRRLFNRKQGFTELVEIIKGEFLSQIDQLTFELTPKHLAYFVCMEYFVQNPTWKFLEFLEAAEETFRSYVSFSWIYKHFDSEPDQRIREALCGEAMRFSVVFDNVDFKSSLSKEVLNRVPIQFLDKFALSWNPVDRLSELFQLKKVWFFSELRAFLEGLTESTSQRDEIIAKHTNTIYMAIKGNALEAFLKLHPCEKESVSEEKATGQLRIRCLHYK
jgi:hypothetical protein